MRKRRWIYYVLACFLAFVVLSPYIWLILCSLRYDVELTAIPVKILPRNITFSNYYRVFFQPRWQQVNIMNFKHIMMNTIIIACLSTVICLAIGSFGAYAYARFKFIGKGIISLFIMLTIMIPGVFILIPLYIFVRKLNMLDTYGGIILSFIPFTLPLVIFILTGFFKNLPEGLEDAARVDGCSRMGVLFRIILPLSLPGIAATSIIIFLLCWNEFEFPMALSAWKIRVLTVALSQYETQCLSDYGLMTATAVLATFPIIVLVLIFQKLIIKGLTQGGIKE